MKHGKNSESVNRRSFFKTAGTGLALGAGMPSILSNSVKPVFGAVPAELPKRVLGKTGMKITTIAMGSHVNPANQRDPEGRVKQLRAAYDLGMNMYDVYEHTYGQFDNTSKAIEPVRKNVYISLAWVPPEGYKGEITKKLIRDVVEDSLKRFKTDYIDMYRVVNQSSEIHRDEMMKMKEEL